MSFLSGESAWIIGSKRKQSSYGKWEVIQNGEREGSGDPGSKEHKFRKF